jgi:hypothetical protein
MTEENEKQSVPRAVARLIDAAIPLLIDEEPSLGFVCRSLTLATLPHRRVDGHYYQRVNGSVTMTMMAPPDVGLAYGSIPRLLIAYLATNAVRTQSREIELGDSMSAFMKSLGLNVTGGVRGDVTRLKNQSTRLFSSTVNVRYEDDAKSLILNRPIATQFSLWWSRDREQSSLWKSSVVLSDEFYREIVEHPIPIDIEVLKLLKASPMQLDLYCWLTYRMSYLRRRTVVPWPSLAAQFGSNYTRLRAFREALADALKRVSIVYPQVRCEIDESGLVLFPSPTAIAMRG